MNNNDKDLLKQAVELSCNCPRSATAYSVGAVVVTAAGEVFTGYSRQTAPHNHAEEEAVLKAQAAGADMRGGAIYTSMEPCTHRKSKPLSCTAIIIREGFSKVVYAVAEPPNLAQCCGAATLREAGIETVHIEGFEDEVARINAHILA